MLIDQWMPEFDVASQHQIEIHAPSDKVYKALRQIDLRHSLIVMMLFRLRGLPVVVNRLDAFREMGFGLLAEKPGSEIVLGLIGKFWTPGGGIRQVDADSFARFSEPGYAQAAWNFAVIPQNGITLTSTETRVRCTDDESRRRFRSYWTLIGPFSGVIRMEMLRLIKKTTLA